jgi:hypothetical protein
MNNIPKYYVYDTLLAPEDLKAKHPNAATYESITLFVTAGSEPTGIVDLASMGFNHPYDSENEGLTLEQLNEMVDGLLSPEPPATTDEVQISKVQADYLYETRFKAAPTEQL